MQGIIKETALGKNVLCIRPTEKKHELNFSKENFKNVMP